MHIYVNITIHLPHSSNMFRWIWCLLDRAWLWQLKKKDQLDVTCYFISLLCAQHVSDINISIIRSLHLFCWITTLVVLFLVRCVLEFRWGWVGVLQAEAVLQPATLRLDTPTQDNSPPRQCIHLSLPPYVLHVPPISFFALWSPEKYWVRSTEMNDVM